MKETCKRSKKTVFTSAYEDEEGYVYCALCQGRLKRSDCHVTRHFKRHHGEEQNVSLMRTRPINPNKTYLILSEDSDESVADHCERSLTEIIEQQISVKSNKLSKPKSHMDKIQKQKEDIAQIKETFNQVYDDFVKNLPHQEPTTDD